MAQSLELGSRESSECGPGRTRKVPQLASVIIPANNAADTIAYQLEALAAQTYTGAWEVIVADNGSADGTDRVCRAWVDRLPHLRIVDASARRGAAHARNVGAGAARGDFLIFLDADDVATPSWLEGMVRAAPHSDLVGGGLEGTALNDPASRFWYPRHRGEGLLPGPAGFLPFALTANLGVHTAVFHHLGGFRPEYTHGGDDVEFCWRAQLAGHRLRGAPAAVVQYRYRPGLGALARQLFDYGEAEARLYLGYRDRGMQRLSFWGVFKRLAWLLVHAVDLLWSRQLRGRWVAVAALRCGRIVGSVRHRVVFL